MYCTPLDLIAYANRARLIGQLAGNDFAALPQPETVLTYFRTGKSDPADAEALAALKGRVQQAIDNASGDIDGYLALVPDVKLPENTLTVACMDMALYRLCERLEDGSTIKLLNDQRHAFFDKLVTGKYPVNTAPVAPVGSAVAEVAGDDVFFTAEQLEGY